MIKKVWLKVGGKIKPYLKPTMLLSFAIAWFITNGWAYLLAFYPHPFSVVRGFALVYVGILYLPFTLEKPITVWIAVRIQRVFIKNGDMKDTVQYNKKYIRKLAKYYAKYDHFKEDVVYGRSKKYNYKRVNFISGCEQNFRP